MNIFVLIGLFFLILFFIGVLLFFILVIDSILYRHDLPTSRRVRKILVEVISQYKPEGGNFYDLGCGRGTLVLFVKKKLPQFTVYGVDNNPVRIFFAKLKSSFFRKKINFKRQDIFQTDLRDADVVYTYLWYDLMGPLEEKLRKELKQGAVVITNTSHFYNWKPVQKIVTYHKFSKMPDFETLFVYVKD